MRRRVLLYLTLIAVSACNGDRIAKSGETPVNPPSADISDATHDGVGLTSNPDFFFLPPMVKNPSASPLWDAGAFNATLKPTVDVCAYDEALKTEDALTDALTHLPLPTCTLVASVVAGVDAAAEQYQVNWKVPTSSVTFYRITVRVGRQRLGYADVETASNSSQLKSVATGDFIPLNDGRTLPIKFRIERNALCETPGDPTHPCTSATVDLSVDNTVSTILPGTQQPTGIFVPAQGPTAPSVTITVQGCTDFNPRVTDLRTFGPCFRVTADDGTSRSATHFVFTAPATVFSCEWTRPSTPRSAPARSPRGRSRSSRCTGSTTPARRASASPRSSMCPRAARGRSAARAAYAGCSPASGAASCGWRRSRRWPCSHPSPRMPRCSSTSAAAASPSR
jgi:hypothetical protein